MELGKSKLHKLTVEAIKVGSIRFCKHAIDEMQKDDLQVEVVINLALRGALIEEDIYHKGGPRCKIRATIKAGVEVTSVWAYNEETKFAALVTVFLCNSWFNPPVRR